MISLVLAAFFAAVGLMPWPASSSLAPWLRIAIDANCFFFAVFWFGQYLTA